MTPQLHVQYFLKSSSFSSFPLCDFLTVPNQNNKEAASVFSNEICRFLHWVSQPSFYEFTVADSSDFSSSLWFLVAAFFGSHWFTSVETQMAMSKSAHLKLLPVIFAHHTYSLSTCMAYLNVHLLYWRSVLLFRKALSVRKVIIIIICSGIFHSVHIYCYLHSSKTDALFLQYPAQHFYHAAETQTCRPRGAPVKQLGEQAGSRSLNSTQNML